jgi:hypothetical protein
MSQERTLHGPSALRRQPENDVAVALERTAHPRRPEATTHGTGRWAPSQPARLGRRGSIEAIAANAAALIATRITIQLGGRAFR